MRTLAALLALLLFSLPAQAAEGEDFSLGLVRHLEYSESGKTAKLISRDHGMNGFETHILNFADTSTEAFKACKPLLEQQLPDSQSLSIAGKAVVTKHENDGTKNLLVYDIDAITRCELYEGGDPEAAPTYNEILFYRPMRRGVENFSTIVATPKEPATPQQDWARFVEQGAELRFIDKLDWGRGYATLTGGGDVSLDNGNTGAPSGGGIRIIFTNLQDPLLKSCKGLMQEPVNTAKKLSVFGYGTTDKRDDTNAPVVLRLNRLIECKLVPAVDSAREEAINAPSSNLWVASMKIGGATFWLHYTGARPQALEKTMEMDRVATSGYPGSDISAAEAWLRRMKVKAAKPMRLGKLELTVEGNAKRGAKKIKKYAEAGSNEHAYMLAHLYFHGLGVEKNPQAAYNLLRSLGPGGEMGGFPDTGPWIHHHAVTDAEAVAVALTYDADGKRRKVDFRMPGEPGAPVTWGYQPFVDKDPEAMMEPPPYMTPPMEEGLTLYSYPYPEE